MKHANTSGEGSMAQIENGSINSEGKREHWGSRIGLILAMAGNAVGLGNFLRFPTQAASNGGGAFMIPYFIAFLLLGIPLMWIEWGIGRYGGSIGHGTVPGIFRKMAPNHRWVKYIGVLGVILPLFITIYYNYIESWTLAYGYFSITGQYQVQGSDLAARRAEMKRFMNEYRGIAASVKVHREVTAAEIEQIRTMTEPASVPAQLLYNADKHGAWDALNPKIDQSQRPFQTIDLQPKYFSGVKLAYLFFLIAFACNFYFVYRGLSSGIEQLGKIGMPILFAFAVILGFRVLTMGTPEGSAYSVADGFSFLWTPRFSELSSASVWLAAAGQIFFTLSLGTGAIHAYASYLSEKDDVVLSGLATASTNEFAEVVLGGSIAIPAAVAMFGPQMTQEIAKGGAFDLGFQSLPMVFSSMGGGMLMGALWFILLFIAGITSSVALLMPAVTFLKDELKWAHGKAVTAVLLLSGLCSHWCIFYINRGVLDEIDYWAGTFLLVVFALIETIMFLWVFGGEEAWTEMHHGADMQIPSVFYYIMKYVTPAYVFIIMLAWGYQDGWGTLVMQNVAVVDRPFIWLTRLGLLAVTGLFVFFIWQRFRAEDNETIALPAVLCGLPLVVLIATYPGLLSIDTNALLFLVCSWSFVFLLAGFSIRTMLTVPAKVHDDFPDEVENETKSSS